MDKQELLRAFNAPYTAKMSDTGIGDIFRNVVGGNKVLFIKGREAENAYVASPALAHHMGIPAPPIEACVTFSEFHDHAEEFMSLVSQSGVLGVRRGEQLAQVIISEEMARHALGNGLIPPVIK